jgi:hypothetical protein
MVIEVISTGTYLASQQSDKRKTGPLAETEWPKELLFGVLKRRIDDVDGRAWQARTSTFLMARRRDGALILM